VQQINAAKFKRTVGY